MAGCPDDGPEPYTLRLVPDRCHARRHVRAVVSRVLLIAHVYIAACTGYLLALLVAAATARPRQAAWTGLDDGDPLEVLRLLVVVPAHDEATAIQATVRALLALDGP